MTTIPATSPQRLAWLTLRRVRGELVTYRRGELEVELTAVPSRPDARQVGTAAEAAVITSRRLDWLCDPVELQTEAGETLVPKHGDRIERASGEVYRVQPTDGQDDVWRWSDPLRTWRRINSEQTSEPV